MNKRLQITKYVFGDLTAAFTAWACFFAYRKLFIDPKALGYQVPLEFDDNFYLGVLCIPIYWLLIYTVSGSYNGVYHKSRFKEMVQTISQTFFGSLVLFFMVLLDDYSYGYQSYINAFFTLCGLHFFFTFSLRFTLTSITKLNIYDRTIGFNTLIIGSNQKAVDLYKELEAYKKSLGYKFVGYVPLEENGDHLLDEFIPRLAEYKDTERIITEYEIEEVIIALETSQHDKLNRIINVLEDKNVTINIIPDMYDIITGMVKMNYLFATPLIKIETKLMPEWQQFTKHLGDIVVASVALILLLPVYLIIAIGVKLSSSGPIIYKQKRIGLHGKPFHIYKFRSMYTGSELSGPQLSSETDNRITPFGRFLRKTRLDELPQFYNVLIGDMSLVGPRPERQFFIDQIVQVAPHYRHLHKVKPGITSWGQVKYGYAENVEQMVERLKYDIIYVENISLSVDIKIIFYTILTVIQGRGK